MKDELTKLDQTIRSHYEEARESVRKAQSEYSSALDKIPTGFKSLLFDLGRAVIGIVKTAGEAFTTGAVGRMGSVGGLMAGSITSPAMSQTSGQTLTFTRLFSDSFNKALPRIKQILNADNHNQSTSNNPNEELEAYKVTFQTFLSSVAIGKAGNLKERASEIIQQGISLVDEVLKITKESLTTGESIKNDVVANVNSRLDKLAEDLKPMVAAEAMNGAGVPPPADASNGMGDSSQNEKFVAQLSLNRLQSAETRYDKIFDQLKQNQQELAKLMGKIASLDMTRIRYKEILELLREALHLLARIREQWGQLVLFFAEIATRAEITLSGTLGPFITQAGQAGSESLSLEERLFYVDLLKAQAEEIDSQSQMLYLMSRTYVDMSTNYIMGRLSGLSKMLLAGDDSERNRLITQLTQETQTSQQAIMDLVTQRKTNYQNALRKRRIELQNFIERLGGPDSDDQAAIEAGKAMLENKS
ncbi:unnamed protein product [Rotaria sp. Silwood2]|nr:unnamed protein product [Rotaria sp. Silwood2]CAF2676141.1 unnamed protein product [Rotaria sp. Silwood2]CAF2955493.1 unnamed protein product [Rotaria sp. Silwood2]CAF3101290.1 unnamed protein product [Rotaria sp. Silwood2]CAF3904677.1 unnamed protein product [Rotaria sp. Silwood2]